MAHFLKGDTDNKKIDKILQKAEDIDLSDYVKEGDAPELDYIYLEEHDESQQGEGESGVLENVEGNLYFNGESVAPDLSDYVKEGDAPALDYIYLDEHDETQSTGSDGVLENIDGSLYLNGQAVGGGGGIQNTATGTDAFAISSGDTATATASNSIAIGNSAAGKGQYSITIGDKASVYSQGFAAIAIGKDAVAGGSDNYGSIAIGRGAYASFGNADQDGCIAIGSGTNRTATSIEGGARANGYYSIAIGTGSSSIYGSNYSVAIGRDASTKKPNEIAIGRNAKTNSSYTNNIIIGSHSSAPTFSASYGVAIGSGVAKTVDHDYAVVFNKLRFIPLTSSDSYTLSASDYAILCDSNGVTYKAPSSTITTTEPSLLIIWTV